MSCENDVLKGDSLVLVFRNDGDTAWEIIGGVKSLSYTIDAPVEDITSSSTTSGYMESDHTGYLQFNGSIDGLADKRTGVTDPVTGLNIVGSARMLSIVTSGTPCAKIRIMNTATNGYVEGFVNITNYNRTSERPGLLGYSASIQSKSSMVFVGEV